MPRRSPVKISTALFLISLAAILTSLGPAPARGDPAGVSPQGVAEQVRAWRQAHEQEIVDSFVQLLSIPNVTHDETNIRRNAVHISSLLRERGFGVSLLEADGAPPVVFAERSTPGADRTLMIYAHYDGQPVEPDDWASDPWTPVLRDGPVEMGGRIVPLQAPFDPEWRLFARSAGDDKAPVIALAAALDALAEGGADRQAENIARRQ